MARRSLCVVDVHGKSIDRAPLPDDVLSAARGHGAVRNWAGVVPIALDRRRQERLAQAVKAGWCSSSWAHDADSTLRAAYWLWCVASRRAEVFACFDEQGGGVTVGACTLSVAREADIAWSRRAAALLRPYEARLLVEGQHGPTLYGTRPRDAEATVGLLLAAAAEIDIADQKNDMPDAAGDPDDAVKG